MTRASVFLKICYVHLHVQQTLTRDRPCPTTRVSFRVFRCELSTPTLRSAMAGPPMIEGSLKNTIHALAFGLICATLAVNFGKYFVPHFFPYMVGIIILIEAVLFALDRPRDNYEKFQVHGIRGTHTIEGSPQITVSGPSEDPQATPTRKGKMKDKLKKGRRESGVPGSPRQSLVPPPSLGQEVMEGKETGKDKVKEKSDKEKKKEEEKEKKKEKEEEKERIKAEKKEEKEKGTDGDEEKGSSWRKRRVKTNKQNTV